MHSVPVAADVNSGVFDGVVTDSTGVTVDVSSRLAVGILALLAVSFLLLLAANLWRMAGCGAHEYVKVRVADSEDESEATAINAL